jgi:hypothetical protein
MGTRLRKVVKTSILGHLDDVNLERQMDNIVNEFRQRSEKLDHLDKVARNVQTNLRSSPKPSVHPSSTNNDAIKERTAVIDYTDGLYIHSAGLIIVAAFLPALFTKLELLDNDTITDVDKAVCVTQYLARGTEGFAEFEVGLAKVLCGVEIQTVIATDILLDDFSKTEANNLLLSIVEHWSILKDTSVSGLQLQNLPWNISMIKLSWMPHLLRTEWVF